MQYGCVVHYVQQLMVKLSQLRGKFTNYLGLIRQAGKIYKSKAGMSNVRHYNRANVFRVRKLTNESLSPFEASVWRDGSELNELKQF